MFPSILKKLTGRESLSFEEATDSFKKIALSEWTEVQVVAFLTALACKGESATELLAAVKVFRQEMIPLKLSFENLIDNCGTGGDHSGTFNISTAAALLAAKAGAKIAKHGNRSVSSKSGSADVLEQLGISLHLSPEEIDLSLAQTGFAFLFAPDYHPALKAVGKIRKEIGIRTIFNLMGPLLNPTGLKRQLVGVANSGYLDLFAEVYSQLEMSHVWIVHGSDGLDEITLTGLTEVREVKGKEVRSFVFDPKEYGFDYCTIDDLKGGEPNANAEIVREILSGKSSPKRNIAGLNAAVVLYLAGLSENIPQAIRKIFL